ncbi:MAG: hypothetical protein LBP83_04470 [Dysgonamonadaceae bacterium]|jgi:hypothetical protein|nr:hypothetical protein [Dysgonamonadaceae bacterium]
MTIHSEEKIVKVVIPLYKSDLNNEELLSLKQCCAILSRYPIVIAKPESLNIDLLCRQYPQLGIESFDDAFFKNLASYNRLMLSAEFYKRFLYYEYILIYQLDAYVFRDELELWCRKKYDYIGAPWIKRASLWKDLKNRLRKLAGIKEKRPYSAAYYKAGNGGFSLRRIQSFYEITMKETDCIRTYLHPVEKHIRFKPEDIFWALEPQRLGYPFVTPDYKEALLFAFDKYPRLCFNITKTIPFGCHAWNRRKSFTFWKKIIV